MSKVTIEIDLNKLSERGKDAFHTLMGEISRPSTHAATSETIERLADKLYARMARKESMRSVLDAILDSKDASLTVEEIFEKTGFKGASLAGVLSSQTRNMKRYTSIGNKSFLAWSEAGGKSGSYHLSDMGLLEPLLNARKKYDSKSS
ncbi:MAG: hypothetical protein PHV36_10700 [Elusimicrobiales bacterium]|nr:hypothetical protein [Elusimicrobiales bacterium]